MTQILALIALLLSLAAPAYADLDASSASVTPQLGQSVPANLTFTDETGKSVRLADYLGKAPIFLVPVYYRCPNLCGATLTGLFGALNDLPQAPGRDYRVIAFSIDPRETADIARQEYAKYATAFPRSTADAHLLTSPAASSEALARVLGFRYSFDAASGQYAHDIEIVTLTPDGVVANYDPTLAPSPADLQAALDDAGKGVIERSVDRLILFCCHLLPAVGRNTPTIEHILQAIAAVTALALGALLWVLLKRGPKARA